MTVVASLLLAAPLAAAGTIDDPEVEDPAGDHLTGQSADPVQALDIRKIYLTEEQGLCDDAAEVTMVMVLANIVTGNSGAPGAAFSSSLYFTINDNDYRTYLRPAPNSGPVADPWIYMYDITADSSRMVINGGIDNSGDEKIWWCVPYANLNGAQPGDVVTQLWGRTYLDNYGSTDLAPDGAPGSGEFGREYVLGGVAPVAGNVTVAPVDNATTLSVAPGGSATYALNVTNQATGNDTIAFAVLNLTDGWNATVDPPNVTVEGNGSATVNVTVSAPASNATSTTIVVDYNSTLGANGTISFEVVVEEPPSSEEGESPAAGNETGNGTGLEDDGDNAVTPGIGPLVILAAVVGAAQYWRRRG